MRLTIGRIVRPHGVRGEVIVESSTDEPEQRFAAGSVLDTDPATTGPLTIEVARRHPAAGQDRFIVGFAGVEDREAAERLRGIRLWVDSADLTEPEDPDEYHDFQLVGLTAVSPEGTELGAVVEIEHAPASDLLVLRRPDGRRVLVPFVRAIVPEVDLEGGRVVLTPPGGLLDL